VTDVLLSTLAVAAFVVVIGLLGIGLVVVPFVLSIDMAERRDFSTTRWGGLVLVLVVVTAGIASRLSPLLFVVPAVIAWTVPAVLALMDSSQARVGGRQGAHQA
jgi:hypothetical protein